MAVELLGSIGPKEYYLDDSSTGAGTQMVSTTEGWKKLPGKLVYRVPAIREAVRALPGFKLVISDLSQIEIKLMTFLSQDPWLIEAVNSGKDMHCKMASDVSAGIYDFDLLYSAKTGKLGQYFENNKQSSFARRYSNIGDREDLISELISARSDVKNVSFMIPYGATVEGIAIAIRKRDKDTGLFTEELEDALARAEKLLEDYFRKAPVLKRYLDKCKRDGIKFGMSKSVRGRIRSFTLPEPGDSDAKNQLSKIGRYSSNFPMQASCVDVLKPAASRFYRNLRGGVLTGPVLYPGARIMLLVHDEIVSTFREEDVPAGSAHLIDAMTWAYNDIHVDINGKAHCLEEIKNKVSVIVDDYWVKD